MLNLVRPQFFVPVHGEYRHLLAHARLAREVGLPAEHAFVIEDGQGIELTKTGARVLQRFPVGRVLVDGKGVGDVGAVVLRDRELLAQDGMVVVAVTVDRVHRRAHRRPGDRLAGLGLRARVRGRAGGGEDRAPGGPRGARAARRRLRGRRSSRSSAARSAASSTSATTGSRSCCRSCWRPRWRRRRAGRRSRRGGCARPRASSRSASPPTSRVALLSYDPALRWVDQGARVGVVGLWVGWASVHDGRLRGVPRARGADGLGVRGVHAPGRRGNALPGHRRGLGLLAVTGLLAQLSGPVRGVWLHRGAGSAGPSRARSAAPWARSGALVLLVTLIAVAGLCITQVSYAGISQQGSRARLAALTRRPRPATARPGRPRSGSGGRAAAARAGRRAAPGAPGARHRAPCRAAGAVPGGGGEAGGANAARGAERGHAQRGPHGGRRGSPPLRGAAGVEAGAVRLRPSRRDLPAAARLAPQGAAGGDRRRPESEEELSRTPSTSASGSRTSGSRGTSRGSTRDP